MTAYTKYTEKKPSLLSAPPPPSLSCYCSSHEEYVEFHYPIWDIMGFRTPPNGNPYTLDFGKFDIKLILIELGFSNLAAALPHRGGGGGGGRGDAAPGDICLCSE